MSRALLPENTFRPSRHVENLKPASQAETLGQRRGFFPPQEIWVCVRSVVCAVPWGWQPAKSCLSDCFSWVGVRKKSPRWGIKESPLCGPRSLTGFSEAAGEYRAGHTPHFGGQGRLQGLHTPACTSSASKVEEEGRNAAHQCRHPGESLNGTLPLWPTLED